MKRLYKRKPIKLHLFEVVKTEEGSYKLFFEDDFFEVDENYLEDILYPEDEIPDKILLDEEKILQLEFDRFQKYASLYLENKLQEFLIPKAIKEKFDIIKELAKKMKVRFKDLLVLFMDKVVFSIFQYFKWNLKKLGEFLKKGFYAYREFWKVLAEYVRKNKVVQWTDEQLNKLDQYLQNHPKIKRIAGIGVAGILLAIWLNMAFIGDFPDDMNLEDIYEALKGNYKLTDLFTSQKGIKMIIQLILGISGLSYLYTTNTWLDFCIALIYNIAKYKKKNIRKADEKEIEQEVSELQEGFTLNQWKNQIMPIVMRTSLERRKTVGDEKLVVRFIGLEGKASNPILVFWTIPTYDPQVQVVKNGKASVKSFSNTYMEKIQLMNFNKWRKGKYLHNMSLEEFKEILDVCEIKVDCSCMFWHWGGLRYMATELDSAIYPTNIPNLVWRTRKGYSEPSLCKHLKFLLPIIKFNSPTILKQIKIKYSDKFRKKSQ